MSTEQKPPATTPPATATPPVAPAEPNALASALAGSWEQLKQGQLIGYRLMAVVLLVAAGIGTALYISSSNRKVASAKWTELESLASVPALTEYVEKNPNTPQARIASLDLARAQLGPDGIDRFAAPDPQVRKTAVENVEKARDAFAKLVDEFKGDPLLKTICLLGAARAEAALVGMPKEGQLETFRGDPAKAIEWLDKVAEAAGETDWGKDAKKLADTLRNQNTQQQVAKLQASVYSIPTPTMPSFDPKSPLGGSGGLPGLGGLPGFPGGP